MTQQEINVFLTVVKTGSLSAAAEALFLTQPAVSRHIRALEAGLGCQLLERGRGRRSLELTDRGRDFVEIARKWELLHQEARELANPQRAQTLHVSAISSIASYLLPNALRSYLSQDDSRAITFHDDHSSQSYVRVAEGLVDIALIAEDQYYPQVETIPAFREPMVLLAAPELKLPPVVHPSMLDPALELRCPWNPEVEQWRRLWFSTTVRPLAGIDQMALLESFFAWAQGWAVVPVSVARAIQERRSVVLHQMVSPPPDRIIYYLLGQRRKPELTAAFLACLKEELARYPEIELLFLKE